MEKFVIKLTFEEFREFLNILGKYKQLQFFFLYIKKIFGYLLRFKSFEIRINLNKLSFI